MPDLQTGIQRGRTGGGFGAFFQTLGSELSKAKERREKEDIQRRKEEGQLELAIQTAQQKAQDQEALERLKSQLKREEDVSFIEQITGGKVGGGIQETDRAAPAEVPQRGVEGLPIPAGEAPVAKAEPAEGFRLKKITRGGVTFERPETQKEIEEGIRREARAKATIKKETLRVEQEAKIDLGKLVSKSNIETLSGVSFDLSNLFVDAVAEGGAGGAIQAGVSGVATKIGDIPLGGGRRAEVGGRYPASGAFPGKRQEMILKMMPMLTQQATKAEGSVRLIEGVLRAIGQTIPDKSTAPRTARLQLEESLKSFFRFARSAELLKQDFDRVFDRSADEVSDAEMNTWIRGVNAAAGNVEITGRELKAMDKLIGTALSPFDKLIKKKDGMSGLSDEELQAIIRGE